ncbi:nitrous oxide reductase family maturation protein NosD [Bdellovibrio sp. HCB274]|uniref:right-handed parallel beta-helix repeat-containing protein n=1 Tax=Bdellovibrio sp. HCB274 TaxID=3394361 RepID=UPI0039B56420
MLKVPILLSTLLLSSAAFAATINIEPCSGGGNCSVLNDAIAAASPGDTIEMDPGVYTVTEQITVDKSLTIRGRGAVISTATGIMISGNDVNLEDLTIRDSTSYGVWILPNVSGTVLRNNEIVNNTTGINLGGVNTSIVNNTISNNNNGDPSFYGYGIYTDESAGGKMRDVRIVGNSFVNNNSTDIGINISSAAMAVEDLRIADNTFSQGGRAIYLINAHNVRITNNTIRNLGAPLGGKESTAIGLWGGNIGVIVTGNIMEDGAKYGVYVQDMGGGTNREINVNRNHITGSATAGLYVEGGATPATFSATCNWWGAASGPRNEAFNRAGRGDAVTGKITGPQFDPWLRTANLDGDCANSVLPGNGFAGIWENRASRSCIAISADESKAASYRKCGPFNCQKREGLFTSYENVATPRGDVVKAFGFINYFNPAKVDQEVELISNSRMRVNNMGRTKDARPSHSLIYNKVERCQWGFKWPWPKPPHPRPKPPAPQPPTPSNADA